MSRNLIDPAIPKIRCAIYTRKSTEERLDQEFNSLDAQREASEAFIASQKAEGWVCLPKLYDDGGFSGGSLERRPLGRALPTEPQLLDERRGYRRKLRPETRPTRQARISQLPGGISISLWPDR